MSAGGIYDQIAGGFARYSVDAYWKVPHFEKMLYDNAQLVSLYSKAYQLTNNEDYKRLIGSPLFGLGEPNICIHLVCFTRIVVVVVCGIRAFKY